MSLIPDNPDGAPQKAPWYFQKSFVIVNLFFVLGPLALPLLIKSPEFSRKEKWVYAFIVIFLLIAALVLGGMIIWIIYKHYKMMGDVMDDAFI